MSKVEFHGITGLPDRRGYVFYMNVGGVNVVSALSFKTIEEAKKYQDIVKEALQNA